jgi:hypothetical protein
MVEVDVHALELEVGGTVVPNQISAAQSTTRNSTLNLLSIAIETVLTGDGLPVIQSVNCEPMTRKKFRYLSARTRKRHQFGYPVIQYQFSPNPKVFPQRYPSSRSNLHTGRFGGEPMEHWGLAKDLFRTGGVVQGKENKRQTRLLGTTYNLTHFEGESVEE